VRHGRPVELSATSEEIAALDGAGELVAVLARRGPAYGPLVVLAVDGGARR
jgi:hypothetical protein